MTREEKIEFIVNAIDLIEGVDIPHEKFEGYTDKQLDTEVAWYDYLLDK